MTPTDAPAPGSDYNPGYVAATPFENASPATAAQLANLVVAAGWGTPVLSANPNASAGVTGEQLLPSSQWSSKSILNPGKFDLMISVPNRGLYNVALCMLAINVALASGKSAVDALAAAMPVLTLWFE